jgi:replicative DNA helicase
MTIFDNVLNDIEDGMRGKNVGLPNGFNRLNTILFNTQKKTYYTIAGEPGSGKSSLALHMFIYSPYTQLKDKKKLKVLYISKELPKV